MTSENPDAIEDVMAEATYAVHGSTKERDIRRALDKRVKAYGGETRAVSWINRAHAPDILVLLPDKHFFVETKAPGGVPRPGQVREHARMRRSGCRVLVISTLDQLDELMPL